MLDPTMTVALDFSDFGSVYSSDGREHPVTGQTPVTFAIDDSVRESPPETPMPAAASIALPGIGWPDWLTPDFLKKKHFKERGIVIVIALIVLTIALLRLTR